MKLQHLGNICIPFIAATALTGCVTDELPECPNEYELQIVFDRNMLFADAFASQVRSVDIKVFDPASGREIFSHTEAGPALTSGNYRVHLPVAPGSYDILCWGSMAEGNSFGYVYPAADIPEHCNVVMDTENGISGKKLNNLYHGLLRNAVFTDNNDSGSTQVQTATIYLTKNTNRLNVILVNLDNSRIEESDFTFSISSHNAEMRFDNSLVTENKVGYVPWHTAPVMTDTGSPDGAVQSAISAEFSVGRLTADSDSRLEVFRTSDGKRIISLPLERNLLLYKGEFHASMADQEYLDRQDDFTMTFILDNNNNWNKAAMIYINQWATPPVQYQEW